VPSSPTRPGSHQALKADRLVAGPAAVGWHRRLVAATGPIQKARTPTHRPDHRRPGRTDGPRQPLRGLPAHPRRTRSLGHRIGASTIRRIVQQLGIPLAPACRDHTTLRRFPSPQASTMLACDFFPVDRAQPPAPIPFLRHRSRQPLHPHPRASPPTPTAVDHSGE
jgi:hypothetical protein